MTQTQANELVDRLRSIKATCVVYQLQQLSELLKDCDSALLAETLLAAAYVLQELSK